MRRAEVQIISLKEYSKPDRDGEKNVLLTRPKHDNVFGRFLIKS